MFCADPATFWLISAYARGARSEFPATFVTYQGRRAPRPGTARVSGIRPFCVEAQRYLMPIELWGRQSLAACRIAGFRCMVGKEDRNPRDFLGHKMLLDRTVTAWNSNMEMLFSISKGRVFRHLKRSAWSAWRLRYEGSIHPYRERRNCEICFYRLGMQFAASNLRIHMAGVSPTSGERWGRNWSLYHSGLVTQAKKTLLILAGL